MAHPERPLKRLDQLARAPESERKERGYHHTLAEILQQPDSWPETESLARASGIAILDENGPVILTGSGSSYYIGESLEPLAAKALGRLVRAVPAGSLLVDAESFLPPGPPGTLVSFARSGDSPESCGVVEWFLANRPEWRHVTITCNGEGALATRYRGHKGFRSLVLSERTNDRSLVMTSSFTNLWIAGRILTGGRPDVASLSRGAGAILEEIGDRLEEVGSSSFESAVYLGAGPRFGAAREGALKMLEMTDGRVPTIAETFLGLRHGPMCAVRETTLLVGFLSPGERDRSYEQDLLRELEEKNVGARTILVGPGGDIPTEETGDDAVVLQVLAAQLLGLFRSLMLGLRPDEPSPGGVITRVVRGFRIH